MDKGVIQPVMAPDRLDARARAWSAEVVLLEAEPALGAPLAVLTDLLAQTIAADFGDRALIVRVIEAAEDPAGEAEIGPDGVARADASERQVLDLRGSPSIAGRLAFDRYDYVFLDLAGIAPARAVRITAVLASARAIHTRVGLHRGREPGALRTIVVTPGTRAVSVPHTDAAEDAASLDTCRIHLDLGRLARRWPTPSGRVPLAEACAWLDAARSAAIGLPAREIFSRWGRALTQRQVGLALGGGGAWAFAHVALIRAMQRAQIPIDVVSGASFGSVIGGYHCARPSDGLDRLLDRTAALERAVCWSLISSEAIARVVDEDLGGRRLDELPLCFLPVATDALAGRRVVVTSGTVGFGVRASGALPGFFTPTTVPGARYVDGGIIDNVPVDVLSSRGVGLIIGSHVVPPPDRLTSNEPPIPGAVGRFLHELDPFARARDFVRSLFVLMHHLGNLEASGAHVIFDAGVSNYRFDFRALERAPQIMASAEPAAIEAVDRIKAAWEKLVSSGRRA